MQFFFTNLSRSNAITFMIMQEARNLPPQHDRLPEIGKGSSVCEEFALDFGWQSDPSHDDGRAQIFENFLFFGESLIDLHVRQGRSSATLVLPPCNCCSMVRARISLTIFTGGHLTYMGCMTAIYQ